MASIWTENTTLPGFSPLEGDMHTDILIIGGGMAGVLCARFLQNAGADYILVEENTIGSGITGNTTAKVTAQHGLIYHKIAKIYGTDAARLYLEANLSALDEYRRLCQSIDCNFVTADNYVYAHDGAKLEREQAALSAIGYSADFPNQIPLPIDCAGAVKFSNQGQLNPLKFLSAMAKGLRIYEHTPVRELEECTARTGAGRIFAKRIIIATHFPFLNKHGLFFLKLYQHRSYCLALEGASPLAGMYVDENRSGLSFRTYGDYLILGGGGHRTGKPGGGWDELKAFAKAHYPQAKIKYRWAAQDCITLDGIPYIGAYSPMATGLYVATGFNKWGMTGAMIAAELLTRQLSGKESPYTSLFSPARRILHPQLAVNAFESAKNLLTFTQRRCPHMGCALKWNPSEHSWDCPCHGSRFEENGKLIDNPASGDLKS